MQGYDIVAQNWRWSNKGEIDIITLNRKSNTLVICEVKTRKSDSVVRGREAVNYKKQQKLSLKQLKKQEQLTLSNILLVKIIWLWNILLKTLVS